MVVAVFVVVIVVVLVRMLFCGFFLLLCLVADDAVVVVVDDSRFFRIQIQRNFLYGDSNNPFLAFHSCVDSFVGFVGRWVQPGHSCQYVGHEEIPTVVGTQSALTTIVVRVWFHRLVSVLLLLEVFREEDFSIVRWQIT